MLILGWPPLDEQKVLSKRVVVVGWPPLMKKRLWQNRAASSDEQKKVMAKGCYTLTLIGLTKGFGKRVAMVVGWPHWMNKKGFNKWVMVVELRDIVCVCCFFLSIHSFFLSFFLVWGCHVIQDIKDMTKILGERIAFFLRTPNLIIVLGAGTDVWDMSIIF